MRIFLIANNLFFLLVVLYAVIFNSRMDGVKDAILFVYLAVYPMLNVLYIYNDAGNESMFSLWIKVKKKKLKDELEK
jgi:hypothetical protein